MAPLQLIGLTGRAGSGKDTLAVSLWKSHGFLPLAFADAMKAEFAAGKSISIHALHDPVQKEAYRTEMQSMGEGRRQQYGPDYWIKHLEGIIWTMAGRISHNRYVITDVRYLNEAAWVMDLGGMVIRLVGRGHALTEEQQQHPSEAEVDLIEPQFEVDNSEGGRGIETIRALAGGYCAAMEEIDEDSGSEA
jgi:hypothetical protein